MKLGSTEMTCAGCQQLYATSDLDRYLWCPNCRSKLKRRGLRLGRLVGIAAAAALAAYLVLRVRASARFLAIYAILLVMTYTLTSRITLAVVQGFYRSRTLAGTAEIDKPE